MKYTIDTCSEPAYNLWSIISEYLVVGGNMIVNQRVDYPMADIVDIGINIERLSKVDRARKFLKQSSADEQVIGRVLSAEGKRRKQKHKFGYAILALVRYRWRAIF
jgi:hypothetical protein